MKYPVLLFIAFFGILIGGQQTAPRRLADIGGNSAGGNAPRRFVSNYYAEIGGGQTSPRMALLSGSVAGVQSPPRSYSAANIGEIGGAQGAPRTSLTASKVIPKYSVYDFADDYPADFEIGGQTTPGSETRNFAAIGDSEIGGGQTAPRSVADIGCGQTASVLKIGGQAVSSSRPLVYANDIGGQSVPSNRPFVSLSSKHHIGYDCPSIEIGGGQTSPRQMTNFQPIGGSPGHERRTLSFES